MGEWPLGVGFNGPFQILGGLFRIPASLGISLCWVEVQKIYGGGSKEPGLGIKWEELIMTRPVLENSFFSIIGTTSYKKIEEV